MPKFSVLQYLISNFIYFTALANFSTTTDAVYNNLMRSHDPSEADFLAVEATVLNVSPYMASFIVVAMAIIVR